MRKVVRLIDSMLDTLGKENQGNNRKKCIENEMYNLVGHELIRFGGQLEMRPCDTGQDSATVFWSILPS